MTAARTAKSRRLASLFGIWLAAVWTAPARAADGGGPTPADLLRRLEQNEARIQALEQALRRESEQLAETQRRFEALAQAGLAAVKSEAHAAADGAAEPMSDAGKPPAAEPRATPAVAHAAAPFTLNYLVQAWYAAGNQGNRDTFKVRRAELYFNGAVTDKARWQVLIDPSKALLLEATSAPAGNVSALTGVAATQASRILQNAFVTLDYVPKVKVSIGQFKLPLSLEGQQSSGRLETVERALFLSDRARGGAYGDVRDIGLIVRGGLGPRVDFQAGVLNGVAETQNDVDRNDQKALAGSLLARPWKGLQVGSSGIWGNGRGDRPRKDRLGFEVQYTRGAFMVKSELMSGHDGPLSRRGYYGHVGYRFAPRIEGVFRVDAWDPDRASEATPASAEERDYVAGLNLFLHDHNLKLQANYLRKTFTSDRFPSRNVFLVNTQTFW